MTTRAVVAARRDISRISAAVEWVRWRGSDRRFRPPSTRPADPLEGAAFVNPRHRCWSRSGNSDLPGQHLHRRHIFHPKVFIMDLQLNDKTAIVTGGTAGIGLEIARSLALEGAAVTITGRDQAKLDRAVADIEASGGARIGGVLADVGTAGGAAVLARAIDAIDILVNNLGTYES